MKPYVYFRESLTPKEEVRAAERYFECGFNPLVRSDRLVIPRYSALPFNKDLERMIELQDSVLINSNREHRYIADADYIHDIQGLTPRTWFGSEAMMADLHFNGPYVVKGTTNSKRDQFWTHMHAETKSDAIDRMVMLQSDGLIGSQGIVFKEYWEFEPMLPNHGLAVKNQPPVINEWRVFVLNGQVLASGFYWSNFYQEIWDLLDGSPRLDEWLGGKQESSRFVQDLVAPRVKAPFYAVDVARDCGGSWLVVEINDGCMSGLSCIDPEYFYATLADYLSLS